MLPKKERLTSKNLAYLFKKGQRLHNIWFNLKYRRNNEPFSRFSVIVSTKILKKAVSRNRLRRQIYEIIRLNTTQLSTKNDITIIARPAITKLDFEELKKTILLTFKSIK